MRTGTFAVSSNSLEGKFFAEHPQDAAKWGEILEGTGGYRLVEVELPKESADTLMRWHRLDGIGPARYGTLQQLDNAMIRPCSYE